MVNRFYSPDQQFVDNSGLPYSGGLLYFYATGTSTPQNTYSDQALATPNANPVVLDSNGQAGSIFLSNLAYKVILRDVNLNIIWTMDPVYTSDYSTFAQFQPYNGNPNGLVAGTAGTQGALPPTSAVWDYQNSILYVCTTTGSAATAVWTAVNASVATAFQYPPQGYLTLASDPSNPILAADSIAATSVFFTPYVGNQMPVYNGSSFVITSFTQLTLTLTASQALNTIYDCFVFSNSGVLTLVTGPAWTTSTAGSGARGSGAGTTQLSRLNGLWVNTVQITGRNGATTYTIPANTATYVGSISIDGTAGQVTCHVSYGQSRKWGVWNAYNRVPVAIQAGDPTASWATATATWRESRGQTTNFITSFCGLPEEDVIASFTQNVIYGAGTILSQGNIGIGVNSTTVLTGQQGYISVGPTGANFNSSSTLQANAMVAPTIGINNINMLEQAPTAGGNLAFQGTSANMLLKVNYRG